MELVYNVFMLKFNPNIRLVLADVDETIADVYKPAVPEMIAEVSKVLQENRVLFLVSGGGLQSIRERICNMINPELRHRMLIAHCSGAEVWGFEQSGDIKSEPYFGIYEGKFTAAQKQRWREIIQAAIKKFNLITYPTEPKEDFIKRTKSNPLAVMLADRGPQITLEFVNAVDLTEEQKATIEQQVGIVVSLHHDSYDLRLPVMDFLIAEFRAANLPVTPKLGGVFALDCIIDGVDKTAAIKFVLNHDSILSNLDIHTADIHEASEIEIWGDKFGQKKGGPDFQMCLAVSPEVRAIDFRNEDPDEIPKDYNIQIWDGAQHLHSGLLEYLKNR